MSNKHIPGIITAQSVGINGPDGRFTTVIIAVTLCSCGRIHTETTEEGSYNAAFWLGVKFAMLNSWNELDLPERDYTEVKEPYRRDDEPIG